MRFGIAIFLSFCSVVVMSIVGSSAEAQQPSVSEEFGVAANEYGVPKELLLAIGYVNSQWETPPPEASAYEPGGPSAGTPETRGAYGIMSLYQNPSKNTLGKAAELTNLSEEELKNERAANIRGGAAVLASLQGAEKPADLNGWYDAVAEYGDGSLYANQVYETLKSGASAKTSAGETVELAPQEGAEPRRLFTAQAAGDYSGATFYGASDNYTNASRPPTINKIVIHMTQGSWSSAINWFQNPSANVSAHYTVRSSDGFIGQSVREADIGWHAGNWSYNETSIGIEHEGYVSEARWFTDAMYRSSARLSAYLAKKYRIPIDRAHIIGHNEVPGATHTDPGGYWNWDKYMSYVRSYAGAAAPAPSPGPSGTYMQVVDNSSSRFRAARAWKSSSYSTQRYGSNYRYTNPMRVERPAGFKLRFPARDKYAIYARWPANAGYTSRATFRIRTASGTVTRVVSQRQSGGRWVRLGTFVMPAGDSYFVQLSSKSLAKGYIIADAVKIARR